MFSKASVGIDPITLKVAPFNSTSLFVTVIGAWNTVYPVAPALTETLSDGFETVPTVTSAKSAEAIVCVPPCNR
jgi:hypothetical protein